MSDYAFIGHHVIASATNIEHINLLQDPNELRRILERGVARANATALAWQEHRFEPQGCTVVGILAESHVSVHTYPEHRALFFDAFTCGEDCKPTLIFTELLHALGRCEHVVDKIVRTANGGMMK